MKRRSFGKLMVAAGTTVMVKNAWPNLLKSAQTTEIELPEPSTGTRSVETCLNSRLSTHGNLTGTLNEQILANILWATSQAPLIARARTIYAALPDGVYRYDSENHKLVSHREGKYLGSECQVFEIGVATDPANVPEDAGAALHWAQLASVPFWDSSSKPTSCPRQSGTERANSSWNPVSRVHLVNCYGGGSKSPVTKDLAALSSDNSLASPSTDGEVILEEAMSEPLFGDTFSDEELSPEWISQILWASAGCAPHKIGSKQGLTVAAHGASYFITGHIFLVTSEGVKKYHMRKPPTDLDTSDHRAELLTTGDRRTQLRDAAAAISKTAPVYLVFCGSRVDDNRRLEAGYSGSSALLQSTALGIQGHYCGNFSDGERTAIRTAAGLPASEFPLLVFAAGKPDETSLMQKSKNLNQILRINAQPNPFRAGTEISFSLNSSGRVEAAIYDASGKLIRPLIDSRIPAGRNTVVWDGLDYKGRVTRSGTYICKLVTDRRCRSLLLHKM